LIALPFPECGLLVLFQSSDYFGRKRFVHPSHLDSFFGRHSAESTTSGSSHSLRNTTALTLAASSGTTPRLATTLREAGGGGRMTKTGLKCFRHGLDFTFYQGGQRPLLFPRQGWCIRLRKPPADVGEPIHLRTAGIGASTSIAAKKASSVITKQVAAAIKATTVVLSEARRSDQGDSQEQ
jgi:hypothetical protein